MAGNGRLIGWVPAWLQRRCPGHIRQHDIDALRALEESWAGLKFRNEGWSPGEFADRLERHNIELEEGDEGVSGIHESGLG